jgi:hypothetical protein
MDFRADSSNFIQIVVRRIPGPAAPSLSCAHDSDGTHIASFTPPYSDIVFTDATGSLSGTEYSYRVCGVTKDGRPSTADQTSLSVLSF